MNENKSPALTIWKLEIKLTNHSACLFSLSFFLLFIYFLVSKSACVSSPCVNGGSCVDATNNDGSVLEGVVFTNYSQYKCVCAKGYAGQNCQSEFKKNISTICSQKHTCHMNRKRGFQLSLVTIYINTLFYLIQIVINWLLFYTLYTRKLNPTMFKIERDVRCQIEFIKVAQQPMFVSSYLLSI